MTVQKSTKEKLPGSRLESERASPLASGKAAALSAALVFAGTLGACIAANFFFCYARVTLATDGRHYLTTAAMVADLISGRHSGEIFTSNGLMGHLMLDGPMMSLFFSPLLAFLGHTAGPRDWGVLALGQSIIQSSCALVLCLIAFRLTRNPFVSAAAGLLWGLYPPAVLKTGHFMSELPTALLLLGLVAAATCRKAPWLALAGFCAGLLVVSKPALAPAVAAAVIWTLARRWREFSFLTAVNLLVPIFAVAVSWMSLCHATTGEWQMSTPRQPAYNAAKAWNPESDGWGANPHPAQTDLFALEPNPKDIILGAWLSNPQESAALAVRKITRLFALPWNDFKNPVLGIDVAFQTLWHQLLLCGGIFGALWYAFSKWKEGTTGANFVPLKTLPAEDPRHVKLVVELSILLVAGHCAYILAESTARYAYTAVPFFVLLAGWALWRCRLGDGKSAALKTATCVVLAMSLTSLITHAEKLTKLDDARNLKEIEHPLKTGDRAEKTIDFASTKACAGSPDLKAVLLLVDGNKYLESSSIEVNGTKLEDKLLPLSQFDDAHYQLFDQFREFTPNMGLENGDIRQWRAVVVPAEQLNFFGKNVFVVRSNDNRSTIFADSNRKSRYYVSPDYFSYGLISSSMKGMGAESRLVEPVPAANVTEWSLLDTQGVGPENLASSLRIRVMTLSSPSGSKSPYRPCKAMKFTAPVPRSLFDPLLWDPNSKDGLRINKPILYTARNTGTSIKLPACNTSHFHITVKGEIKATGKPGKPSVVAALTGSKRAILLGNTPPFLRAAKSFTTFEITDVVPVSIAGKPGEQLKLDLALYPMPWMEAQYGTSRRTTDAVIRNLQVEVTPVELPDLYGHRTVY